MLSSSFNLSRSHKCLYLDVTHGAQSPSKICASPFDKDRSDTSTSLCSCRASACFNWACAEPCPAGCPAVLLKERRMPLFFLLGDQRASWASLAFSPLLLSAKCLSKGVCQTGVGLKERQM